MTNKQVTINLLSSHQLQEQMKPEEIETIFHGKPTDADILTVVTKQGIRHFCDEVEFVTDGEQPVQDGTEPFNTEGLRWHPMSDPMLPWKDKLRKFFLKKDYPKMVDVRPDNDTIVITKYSDDSHYEIVEYANRTWVTELDFPVKPSHWAYVPQKVVNLADSIIKQIKED